MSGVTRTTLARTYRRGQLGYSAKCDGGPYGWRCGCCGVFRCLNRAGKPLAHRAVRRRARQAINQLRYTRWED